MKMVSMVSVIATLLFAATMGVPAHADGNTAKEKNPVGEMQTASSCAGINSESSASRAVSGDSLPTQTEAQKQAAAQAAQ